MEGERPSRGFGDATNAGDTAEHPAAPGPIPSLIHAGRNLRSPHLSAARDTRCARGTWCSMSEATSVSLLRSSLQSAEQASCTASSRSNRSLSNCAKTCATFRRASRITTGSPSRTRRAEITYYPDSWAMSGMYADPVADRARSRRILLNFRSPRGKGGRGTPGPLLDQNPPLPTANAFGGATGRSQSITSTFSRSMSKGPSSTCSRASMRPTGR